MWSSTEVTACPQGVWLEGGYSYAQVLWMLHITKRK
jgi:hypothetical protein